MYNCNGEIFLDFRGFFRCNLFENRKTWLVFTDHTGDKFVFYYAKSEIF